MDRLVPLADKENEAATARRLARDARSKAERFYQSLALRHAAEVDPLGKVVLELRRLVARLRLAAAEKEKSTLEAELAEAKALVTAWRETEKVLPHPPAP